MKGFVTASRWLAAAAFVGLSATVAQAAGYSAPAPVYHAPPPVFRAPAPAYHPPATVHSPATAVHHGHRPVITQPHARQPRTGASVYHRSKHRHHAVQPMSLFAPSPSTVPVTAPHTGRATAAADAAAYDEKATYRPRGIDDYGRLETEILEPMETAYQFIREIGTGISHHVGAFG
jgi:hypothetical protein